MPEASPDERWLEVLAGRADPGDTAPRRAAVVRQHYEERARRDANEPIDPRRLERLLAAMDSRIASESQSTVSMAPPRERVSADGASADVGETTSGQGGWLSALRLWLFPPQSAYGWRLGTVAAGLLGIAIALHLLPIAHEEGLAPEPTTSTPASSSKSVQPPVLPVPGVSPDSLVVVDRQPMQRAMEMRAALERLGVPAQLEPTASGARLQAVVPAERSVAVQMELNQLGLFWPRSETLQVEFRASP